MKNNSKNGFTLVEILVVVAVIGILATIVIVALAPARAKARDAKRKAEIAQIGRFLALSCYIPDGGSGDYDLMSIMSEVLAKNPQYSNLLSRAPQDPLSGTDTESFYKYIVDTNQKKCALYANLENDEERITLPGISQPTAGGGTGILRAASKGWNGSNKYFQMSN